MGKKLVEESVENRFKKQIEMRSGERTESAAKNSHARTALVFCALVSIASFGINTINSQNIFANASDGDKCTDMLPSQWCDPDNGSKYIIRDVINIAMAVMLIFGVTFIVRAGILWATAGDDTAKVAKAKKHILEISVGILLFFCLGILINIMFPTVKVVK